jgi:hypothetical protein
VYSNGTVNTSELPTIPAEDVVAFTTYNPDNLTRGLSTLEALRMTLLNEDAARRATASMWAKGARPAMILTTDQSLSEGASKRLKAQFDAAHAGADNTGSTVVFEEGVKAQVVQLSAEEMQYIESRKLNREEVCAAYDVPPPVVHILDHATFSNITEQLRSQYRDTMAPRFVNFESVIDHQLVPDFYPDRDVFTRFNMEEVLRGDFETKATATCRCGTRVHDRQRGRGLFGLPKSTTRRWTRCSRTRRWSRWGRRRSGSRSRRSRRPRTPVESRRRSGGCCRRGRCGRRRRSRGSRYRRGSAAGRRDGALGRAKQAGATVKTWEPTPPAGSHGTRRGDRPHRRPCSANGAGRRPPTTAPATSLRTGARMDVIRKDATITNTDDAFPGSFEVILSAPTKDRDGETLLPRSGSSRSRSTSPSTSGPRDVRRGTVGSGVPRSTRRATSIVSGTYSSLPHAQDTRTLVKEGHINRRRSRS